MAEDPDEADVPDDRLVVCPDACEPETSADVPDDAPELRDDVAFPVSDACDE